MVTHVTNGGVAMLTKEVVARKMVNAAAALRAQTGLFGEIDSRFGDGDHGFTMGKIADLIDLHVAGWGDESFSGFFSKIGFAITEVRGGSAGPLYGTMIGGMGECLTQTQTTISAATLKSMFASSLSEMRGITTAKVGDKTMMDALIPAVEAAQAAPDDVDAILAAVSEAALSGAKASENFVSKFGRARSYKEQTIGTPDAGAVSVAVFLSAFAKG